MNDVPETPASPAPAPVTTPQPPVSHTGEVIAGFFLAIGLHIAALGSLAMLGIVVQPLLIAAGAGLLGIGAAEWLWLVPAIVVARRRGRKALAKGMIISGALVALLNGGCWALFLVNPPDFR